MEGRKQKTEGKLNLANLAVSKKRRNRKERKENLSDLCGKK